MKKMTLVACAAVLTSAVALTGCKGNQNEPEQKKEAVKTEFSIALPSQLRSGQNRMPSENVQKNGASNFQGITGIYVIPFAGTSIEGTSTRLGTNIHLAQDVEAADVNRPSAAKVYKDISIPLTTSSFLFYGKSAAANDDVAKKFENGSVIAHFEDAKSNPSAFTFDLEQIKSDFSTSVMQTASADGYKLMGYLTSIASADDSGTKWYEYTANAGLKDMFTEFSRMHGLSSFEIARVLTDINQSLEPLVSSNTMAAAIRTAIEAGSTDYVTVDNTTHAVTMKSPYDQFPQSYNLPQGSIDILWDGTNHVFKEGLYNNMARPEMYVYPAQLWYYANSAIKTSNTSKRTMYDDSNDWGTILNAHNDGTSVSTRTRAVAIKDTIQYAVARLDVAVKLDAASLDDNMDVAVGNPTDRKVDCSHGFKVTGIFVGGQKQVGFDFAPKGTTEYTIYDKTMADANMKASSTDFSSVNHTLVFENGNEDVMIAVELENPEDGDDFYGVDNMLIAKGSKFYVIAKLAKEGATKTAGHVFKQDYTTTANLTLKNLRKAYNTLPDLRTPQLELGFSVNLSWRNGNTYNVDFE